MIHVSLCNGVQCRQERHYSARMRRALRIHPDSQCTAVTQIEAEVVRQQPHVLSLRFVVSGKLAEVRWPLVTTPARADELWRHTCFEAFVRASPTGSYYELNLAPSKQWAVYRFTGYRSGMRVASATSAPDLEVRSDENRFELLASLELGGLPDLPADASWYLGLSAVIEETSGRMSYWALAHPPGGADFHHSDCFCLELPAA